MHSEIAAQQTVVIDKTPTVSDLTVDASNLTTRVVRTAQKDVPQACIEGAVMRTAP